jgi:hypothetical protein
MAVLCHGIVMWISHPARLETHMERDMLHAENQDRLYLISLTTNNKASSAVSLLTFRIAIGWCIARWAGISMRICRRRIC